MRTVFDLEIRILLLQKGGLWFAEALEVNMTVGRENMRDAINAVYERVEAQCVEGEFHSRTVPAELLTEWRRSEYHETWHARNYHDGTPYRGNLAREIHVLAQVPAKV